VSERTRLADLMAQASPHLPLALSAALQAEHMAVCQELGALREVLIDVRLQLQSAGHHPMSSVALNIIDAALERQP
jgi:hypothetical protein